MQSVSQFISEIQIVLTAAPQPGQACLTEQTLTAEQSALPTLAPMPGVLFFVVVQLYFPTQVQLLRVLMSIRFRLSSKVQPSMILMH
jgi:hypothetical protein